MDRRCETRFWIKSPAKLTLQGNPDSAFDCILLDISATGIGLITKESVPVGEIVVLDTEEHLVLAKVRHCGLRGDGFSIGAERLHTIAKLTDASEERKVEQRRGLFKEFHGETPAELPLFQWGEAPLDEFVRPRVDSIDPIPKPLALPPTASAISPGADLQPAPVEEPAEPAPRSAAAPPEHSAAAPHASATAPEEKDQAPAPPLEALEPEQPQVESIASRPPKRSWRIPVGVAAAVGAGILVFALHQNTAQPDYHPSTPVPSPQKSAPSEPVAATEQPSTPPPAAAEASATPIVAQPPAAAVQPEPQNPVPPDSVEPPRVRHAQIRAIEPSWFTAFSDGKEIFRGMLAVHETMLIEFTENAVLRIGNSAGVEVSLEGKPIVKPGERGKARQVELTPTGIRLPQKNTVAAKQ